MSKSWASLAKSGSTSWAALVSGDKEQIANLSGASSDAKPALKRLPSKSLANDVSEKKIKDESAETPLTAEELEHRHKQRFKQIEIGKQTLGYQNYIVQVPISERKPRNDNHPLTPDHKQNCSKRSWDGQVKIWRRKIHFWTPKDEGNQVANNELTGSGFYEAEAEEKEPSFSSFSSRPLPPVVTVNVEPMQLGGSENSLLGQWAANSNSATPMELQGESCLPTAVNDAKEEKEMIFIPFQFDD